MQKQVRKPGFRQSDNTIRNRYGLYLFYRINGEDH